MNAGQRRRVLDTLFDELVVDDKHVLAATPKAGWLEYLDEVVGDRCHVWARRDSNPSSPLCAVRLTVDAVTLAERQRWLAFEGSA